MLTEEEYDEITERQAQLDDISCSCHICPPCSKCTEYPSDEELEAVKKYETLQGEKK